ncbi:MULTISPECIES: flavin reductase family protein [unclassified Pseudodesulfovibrio]|uniref:flavin reductase family protein n=1 Tax=unclassified Pseudodesulfovibrio TaxID=2661612 RepID=UPI000FEC1AB5|nr:MULTISPECIES: flavin reductase family protein [unclassified Pseudodesulfovibrio]MCJ2166021.1 flavin reductase family protein [Pseudodesulfovibrio sp. S3-i]RWU02541.1 flavin reductase family protein [Pseudodesulfovibrio sp. S3]
MKKSLGPNTLAQPTPVWAVGAYDEDGKPNAMIAAWGGICSSDPASMAVSLRPNRHTYAGIMKHNAFTISVCPASLAAQADYLGIVSGKKEDKFAATGLTPVKSDCVNAPYIDEFPLIIECELSQTLDLNVHILLIGKIVDVKCDEDKLVDGKHPDPEKILPMIFSPGTRAYHTIGKFVGKGFDIGKKFMK